MTTYLCPLALPDLTLFSTGIWPLPALEPGCHWNLWGLGFSGVKWGQ